jgi:dihydropteroate synthase
MGTAGAVAASAYSGAHILRVHDVKAMVQVVQIVDRIRHAGDPFGVDTISKLKDRRIQKS